MKKLCIFGAGGFAKEVYCLAVDSGLKNSVECFLESDEIWEERMVLDVVVKPFSEFNPNRHCAVIAVGDPIQREKIALKFPAGTEFFTLIHPTATISNWVNIGEGSVICAGNILTCDISLGKHVHLNLYSTIGHDCLIGDFFTTAPSVNISGKNKIGNRVYVGTGAATRDKLTIVDDVIIGMGSIVVKDILESGVYIGNPAKRLSK